MVKQEHGTPTVTNHFSQDSYYKRSPLRILLAEDDLEMRRYSHGIYKKRDTVLLCAKMEMNLCGTLDFLGHWNIFTDLI